MRTQKSKRKRRAGNAAGKVYKKNSYRILTGGPEGRRPLGRPWRRWKDNIKIDL
jgi:hypothetical protein